MRPTKRKLVQKARRFPKQSLKPLRFAHSLLIRSVMFLKSRQIPRKVLFEAQADNMRSICITTPPGALWLPRWTMSWQPVQTEAIWSTLPSRLPPAMSSKAPVSSLGIRTKNPCERCLRLTEPSASRCRIRQRPLPSSSRLLRTMSLQLRRP